jgi:hypothetical protein
LSGEKNCKGSVLGEYYKEFVLQMNDNIIICGNGSEMIGSQGGIFHYNKEEVGGIVMSHDMVVGGLAMSDNMVSLY